METVTVSARNQVVIPRTVREALGIRPGTKMQVIPFGNGVNFIPARPLRKSRCFIKGRDRTIDRE